MPQLFEDLEFAYCGFLELHQRRGAGFGTPLPIALPDVIAWLEEQGVHDFEEREELRILFLHMDAAFFEWFAEQHPSGGPPGRQGG